MCVVKNGSNKLLPYCALVAAMLLWGSSFVAMKYSFRELHPLAVIAGRMGVAVFCFLPFVQSFRKAPLVRGHVPLLVLMCLCEPCLYFLFEAAALMYTSASQASMISTMLPLMAAMSAGVLLKEQLSFRLISGFVIAAGGAILLSYAATGTAEAPRPLLGNFLEFMAMVCSTGYTLSVKYLSRELKPLYLSAVQALSGFLFFLPMLLLPQVRAVSSLHGKGILLILYLGVAVSFGAYSLYNFGVSRIPVSRSSAFINLIPVFSILLGVILLKERLNVMQVSACLLVFTGVLLSQSHFGFLAQFTSDNK